MKKSLIQKLGLLGVVSLLSYTAAVVFSPLAYPGYNFMAQAVSDLSAANAPSLSLWNRLSAFYNVCGSLCNRRLRRHTGAKNQAFENGNLFVCRYGMDFGGRLQNVPVER